MMRQSQRSIRIEEERLSMTMMMSQKGGHVINARLSTSPTLKIAMGAGTLLLIFKNIAMTPAQKRTLERILRKKTVLLSANRLSTNILKSPEKGGRRAEASIEKKVRNGGRENKRLGLPFVHL